MFNKNRTHLKLCQLILIFRSIEQIKLKHSISQTFFAGDFNLIPNSSLYEWVTNNSINIKGSVYEFSNQTLGLFRNLEGNEDKLLLLNNKYDPFSLEYKKIRISNYTLMENIVSIIPILDHFGDEIVFCNIESMTKNLLVCCFNSIFTKSCHPDNYYLRNSNKYKHIKERGQVISHIINCLSKKMNFTSSYSEVKSRSLGDSSNNDVLVTQFGEDIKGKNSINRFFKL